MLATDRFAECLKSLCLNEYPCHNRLKTKKKMAMSTSAGMKRENCAINEIYEIEELLDLLTDKKSPWYEIIDWSQDADKIRKTYIREQSKINIDEIERYFTTLRLNNLQISQIDRNLRKFVNLKELILNCNMITECDTSYLPDSIEIFELTGNYLTDLTKLIKKPMIHLQHLGLGYNWIENLNGCFSSIYWPSIRSLDLQYNQFDDLLALIQDLDSLSKLKVLVLHGNPVTLLPGYRGLIIDNFPNLIALDDKVISREEIYNSQDFKLYSDYINKEAEVQMIFHQLRNLIVPEQPEIEDGQQEISIYKYLIRFNSIDDQHDPIIDVDFKDFRHHKLHSMAYSNKEWKKNCTYKLKQEQSEEMDPAENITFADKSMVKLKYRSIRQFRDFLLDGTTMEVIERKRCYQSKDYVQPDPMQDGPKKKANKKEEPAKKDEKKSKTKKGPSSQLIDNYNLISTDDRVLATFDMNLVRVLDGATKEVDRTFSHKHKVEPKIVLEVPGTATTGLDKRRKSVIDKKGTADLKGNKSKMTKEVGKIEEPETVEPLPLELDVTFKILDFNHLKELKDYANCMQ